MPTSTLFTTRVDGINSYVNVPAVNNTIFWRDGSGTITTFAFSTLATVSGGNTFLANQQFNSTVSFLDTLTFADSVNFSYGTTSAPNHRAALGLGTLATQNGTFSDKANVAGGNTFNGTQAIGSSAAFGNILSIQTTNVAYFGYVMAIRNSAGGVTFSVDQAGNVIAGGYTAGTGGIATASGNITSGGKFVASGTTAYANDAAADADATLPSGGLYTLTGSRVVYRKP